MIYNTKKKKKKKNAFVLFSFIRTVRQTRFFFFVPTEDKITIFNELIIDLPAGLLNACLREYKTNQHYIAQKQEKDDSLF